MVSFARARTKSLISRLLPLTSKSLRHQSNESHEYKKPIEEIAEQNKCFLEAIKNGGMWFS